MARRKRIVYDFKDTYNCIIKCRGKKRIVKKASVMKQICNDRLSGAIKITPYWQIIRNPLYILNDVCKYIFITPSGDKVIIKNVKEDDLFFEDLEALSTYRAKVIVSDYDFHPSFRNEDDLEFVDPNCKKR